MESSLGDGDGRTDVAGRWDCGGCIPSVLGRRGEVEVEESLRRSLGVTDGVVLFGLYCLLAGTLLVVATGGDVADSQAGCLPPPRNILRVSFELASCF
jgi:hypothetical protein